MAHIDACVPGSRVRILKSGVERVQGRTGTIVEVSRVKRGGDALQERITVEVAGHGEVVVSPRDLEVVSE